MTIVWRPAMSVGNDLIDEDHRKLITLINAVESALDGADEGTTLAEALDALTQYTHVHFEREERLMRTVRYNGYVLHRQSHRGLVERLGKIRARIEGVGSQPGAAIDTGPVVELLRSWLIDHVLKEDLLYKPSLAGYPNDYPF